MPCLPEIGFLDFSADETNVDYFCLDNEPCPIHTTPAYPEQANPFAFCRQMTPNIVHFDHRYERNSPFRFPD
jgi:hypothetical protein